MTTKAKAKTKKTAENNGLQDEERRKLNAKAALMPSVNAASVIKAYQGNILGNDVDFNDLVEGLRGTFQETEAGDLSKLESMLIAQATALQTIFTSLVRRAQVQEYQRNLESFLSLGLKAQAQSRATIQALVELKYPRQIAFVKQANISHGPQQVNNGQNFATNTRAHAEENQSQQNKLLVDGTNGSTYLDSRATTTTSGSNSTLEAVGAVHRAKERGG